MAKPDKGEHNKGQSKLVTITNATTNEVKEIPRHELKANKAQLEADGWTWADDDDAATEVDEPA